MKLKAILISILAIVSLNSCGDFIENALTDETYTDTLQQRIGGKLIRTIHYYDTFHSWDYNIQYAYKNEFDSVYAIGKGNYHEQELPKDEPLIQFISRPDNWDSVSKVQKIESNGNFSVLYTFAKEKRIPFFKTGKRLLHYKINIETGQPELVAIVEP